MPENAWSLLAFTLLSQMSVGAFCVIETLNFCHRKKLDSKKLHFFRLYPRLFVMVSIILAGISAIFHLRNWTNAYHAFNNVKTSWISKEMVFFILFVLFVALLILMSWRKIQPKRSHWAIVTAGILCGIALIFSMARIYMLPTVPVWDAWTTPSLFVTTTFLLGSLAVACLMQTFLGSSGASFLTDGIRERWSWKTLPTLVKLAMFFLAMGIFISGFFAHRLIAADTAAAPETFIMAPDKQILFFSRIFFFIVGWVLLVLYLKRLRLEGDNRGRLQRLVYGAFALVTLAEILGRYLFYASFYRIGL